MVGHLDGVIAFGHDGSAPMSGDAEVIESGAMMRSWGYSIALHAAAWGLGLWLMSQGARVSTPTFLWEVSMADPALQSREAVAAAEQVRQSMAPAPPDLPVTAEKRLTSKLGGHKGAVVSARSVVAAAVSNRYETGELADVTSYDIPPPSQSPDEPKDTMDDEAQEQPFLQSLSSSHADAPSEGSALEPTPTTSLVVAQNSVRDGHGDDFSWLMQMLWSRVTALKRYPAEARLSRWEGRVIVRAVIDEHGHLLEVSIAKSSGHDVLDEDAIAVITRACPLALSQPLGQSRVVLRVPIQYRLDS